MPNFNPVINLNTLSNEQVQFGTSGLRGLVFALTDEICYAYTLAFIQYIQAAKYDKIALGGDLRSSTPRITQAIAKAITDCQLQPVNCGQLPTPALAYYAQQQGIPAMMVTGSHIPDDRNGIKFYTPKGEILKADEQAILQQSITLPPIFSSEGGFTHPPTLSFPFDDTAQRMYLQRYLSCFPDNYLTALHIGVYQHSGVARDLLVEILQKLGAKVTCLHRAQQFVPVDTEAIREEDVILAQQWSQQYHFDAIVSTDGDADRPLIADEQGNWLRGDIVALFCAQYLGIEHLVTPISSNTVVEQSQWFTHIYRTRIGSPYVIEKMQSLPHKQRVAGYEANGGFLLGTDINLQHHTLSHLATRDAVLVILTALQHLQNIPLSQKIQQLPARYTHSTRIKNIPSKQSQAFLAQLNPLILQTMFRPLCGEITDINTLDGIRMIFENKDIIHFRASGNAPELRCYTESESYQKAQDINQHAFNILLKNMKKLDSIDNKPY